MKFIFRTMALCLSCLLGVSLNSCKDSEDEPKPIDGIESADFVGSWKQIDDETTTYYVFNEGKTGRYVEVEPGFKSGSDFRWDVDNGKLKITMSGEPTEYYNILEVSTNAFRISQDNESMTFFRCSINEVPSTGDDEPEQPSYDPMMKKMAGKWKGTDGSDVIYSTFTADGKYSDSFSPSGSTSSCTYSVHNNVVTFNGSCCLTDTWNNDFKVTFVNDNKMVWTNSTLDKWGEKWTFQRI